MLRYIHVFLLFFAIGFTSFSQGNPTLVPFPGEQCASSYLEDELLRTDPAYLQMRNLMEQQVQSFIAQQSSSRAAGVVYTIPVVFHIMHEGEAEGDSTNIPYAQALSCIAALNRDFRRTNADGGIAQSGPLGVDAEIEFCIAQRDPNGDSTNGVTRHDMSADQGYLDSGVYHNAGLWRHDASMKALVQWNPSEYLNVWVVNKIRSTTNIYAGGGGGIIGYATFPGGSPARDGIVIRFSATGNDPTGALGYNLWFATDDGRVLTHELGHYLNLYHTFQSTSACGISGVNCATIGDRCCDTPPTTVGAGNNCTSPVCPLENKENYMQYQNGACASDFTPDQVARMRAVLASTASWARNDLVTNNNCIAPPGIDLELDTIFAPTDSICSNSFVPEIVVCNLSSSNSITSFDVKYKVDAGVESTFNWTGNLLAGACDTFLLPSVTSTSGNHTFTARVDSVNVNGSENDNDATNNIKISNFSLANNSTAPTQTISVCDSFSSPSGKVWTTSGTYFDTISNASGCDSLMTFNLTINGTPSIFTYNVIECDSMISPTGKIWRVGGIHYDTLTSFGGCDSILKFYLTINYSSVNQIIKLVASDRNQDDNFGSSVSISGNYAIVGALQEDHTAAGAGVLADAGSAYIFEKNSSGQWSQVQKIVASDRGTNDNFGSSVSISGRYAIVGAYQEDHDTVGTNFLNNSGSAYIFEREISGVWVEKQKLVSSDRSASDNFGWSVSIDNSTAVISAYLEDEDALGVNTISSSGSAYVFERNMSGVWIEEQKIVASDRATNDEFGRSVSVSGNTILVSTINEDEDETGGNTLLSAGSAYFFTKNQSGVWIETQKVVSSDRESSDLFGYSVSVDKSFAVIGAAQEDQDTSGGNLLASSGSSYIFERNNNGLWIEKQKLVAPDREASDFFGNAVSVSGNFILIGAQFESHDTAGLNPVSFAGSAYVFRRESSGVWNHLQKIVANDRGLFDFFGSFLALDGNSAIIGALNEDEDTTGANTQSDAGSAYIFQLNPYVATSDTIVSACYDYTAPSGKVLNNTGIFFDTILTSSAGCDSIITIDLTINVYRDTLVEISCDTFNWRGNNYFSDTIISDTVTTGACDSIFNLDYTKNPTYSSSFIYSSVCDSITLFTGRFVDSTGFYSDTFNTVNGCDSIFLFNVTVNYTSRDTQSIIICDSLISPSGKIWKTNGTYFDTINNNAGCDSLMVFNLTIYTAFRDTLVQVHCDSPTVWRGTIFNSDTLLSDTVSTGICDSIFTLDFTNNPTYTFNFSTTACDSITLPYGLFVDSSGTYIDSLSSVNGCDSMYVYTVQVSYTTRDTQTINVCDSLISPSGKIWKTSGVYTDTTNTITHPCDSIVTFNLTISTVYRDTLVEIKCDSSIAWRGSIYTSTGIINDTISTGVCDSIFTLDFTRNPTYITTISHIVCDSITVLTGRFVDTSGTYIDTFNTVNGCDSIYIYNVIVNYKDTATINMTVCDSLISPSGKIWKADGTYSDTINTVNGCDSLMTFNLIINTVFRDTLVEIKCDSSFTWRGTTYNSTVIVNDTVTTGVCDSIYTLDFTRNPTYVNSISYTVCDSITVLTGRFVDTSGTYIDTFNTVNGCDSIYIYNVVVNYKDTATITVITCDSLVSPSGKSWKSSGTYYDTINTVNGCDSLMTFNLTLTTASVITNPTVRACYSATVNGVTYTSSQNIYDTIFLPGCDTIKITPVIIDTNTTSISTLSFCDSLVAASGKVYKNSGFYRDTMPNAVGCDSLVEYYLTAYKSTVSHTLVTACGSYTSPFGNTYTTSGNYADTLSTSSGCDSIINTLLIIDTVSLATIDSTICFGDSIVLSNGTVAKTSGVYYDTVFGSIPSSLLYSEDFQSTPYSFTLNTNDTNAITPGTADNAWIINSSYAGGSVFGSPIVNTPNQDASITGNINSTYLHIYNRRSATLSFPSITNSNYIDGNIVLLGGQNGLNFSKMTNDISTAGKSKVSFDMYYLCRGSFGRLYYSLNSGTTWTRVGGNLNNGGTSWSQISLVDPVFANQPTIRFAVGFNNTDGLGVSPGFAVDQIAINGIGASSSNCDSITTINLTVSPLIDTNLYDTICRGQSITLPGGTMVATTGIYRDTFVANTGCDSIVLTNLFVHDTTQSSFNLRDCDTIVSPSGKIWTTTGSYIDSISNSVGCDSVMYINIIVDTLPITIIDTSLCFNDSLILMNGTVAKTNGTYYDTLPTIRCDSLVIYNITILPLNDTVLYDSICTYETHTLPSGNVVNTSGVYRDTLTSSINCDSIIITNLFVGDTSSSNQVVATCDSLISPSGKIWKTTGIYLDTIMNAEGCDSLMSFNVTISYTTFINSADTACDSLVWRLSTRNTTGLHYDTISTGVCDTIYVLNLLINDSYNNTVSVVSCDSFTLPGGTTIYSSGLYSDTLMTISGCDSIINSNVTINNANSSSINLTSCDSLLSPSGKTYSTTGIYFDTILNVGGCDSVITINLTILNSITTTVFANGCDTFSLPGGSIVTATGTYRDTLVAGNGCDSIVVTNLVLGNSSNITQTITLCAGETTSVGSSTYGATGMYSDTLTTVLGCDSIINTNLTINPLTPGAITFTSNMCQDAAAVSFLGAPAGGKWFGPGIDSTTGLFDPAIAGVGIHIISYKGPGLCGITDSANVEVYSVPAISFTLTDDECDVGQGEIDVTITGGTPTILYTWSNGETTEDLMGLREETYTLNVVDANGCRARESISVINVSTPDCDYNIFVPNVFSPDGNGENDVLRVEGNGVESVEITIFNRWGNLVFKSTSQDVGWDGTYKGQPVNQGAFVYFVKGTFVDGKSFEDKGTVTVIRR